MREFLATGQAARLLGLSRERVRDFIQDGRLRPVAKDGYGRALLSREAVEHLRQTRERAQASARQEG